MPALFDLLYREYCRARLVEMRSQLLLRAGTPAMNATSSTADANAIDRDGSRPEDDAPYRP